MACINVVSFFVAVIFVEAVHSQNPIVMLSHGGQVQGWTTNASDGSIVNVFYNIPYAEPPIGENRWKIVGAHQGWFGVMDCTKKGAACWQSNASNRTISDIHKQDEDCLFLNVHTPDLSRNDTGPYAVMIYFHGGSFEWDWGGNPIYEGMELVKHGVILVTVNYRLGRMGFLSTSDEAALGNYGMYDQMESMRWVQEHITNFNGDPERVTIFGQSAGAASCSLHMISPLTEGLFHRGLSQSGSSASIWAYNPSPRKFALRLAEALDCGTEDNEDTSAMIDCLRTKDPRDIVTVSIKQSDWVIPFAPVVDGPDGFLPDKPWNLLAAGNYPKRQFISGTNKDEGVSLMPGYAGIAIKDINAETLRTHVIPTLLHEGGFEDPSGALYDSVLMEYVDWSDPWNDTLAFWSGAEAVSHVGIMAPMDLEAQYHTNNSLTNWIFSFDYVFESWPSELLPEVVAHSFELVYIFDIANRVDWEVCIKDGRICIQLHNAMSDVDRAFTNLVTTLWTNFAKYGDPTPGDGVPTSNGNVTWRQYEKKNGFYLALNEISEVREALVPRASEFWNYYFYNLDEIANYHLLTEEPITDQPTEATEETEATKEPEPTEETEELWAVVWTLVGIGGALFLICLIMALTFCVFANKSSKSSAGKSNKGYIDHNF